MAYVLKYFSHDVEKLHSLNRAKATTIDEQNCITSSYLEPGFPYIRLWLSMTGCFDLPPLGRILYPTTIRILQMAKVKAVVEITANKPAL